MNTSSFDWRHRPRSRTGTDGRGRFAGLRWLTSRRSLQLASAAILMLALALAGFLAAGCGGQGAATAQPSATGRALSFTTEDGITLGGHLFGSGQAGVILAHMYPADQASWYPTARRLAQAGYLVLTFDFRGYGESGGAKQLELIDRDVSAAITTIRQQGAAEVVLAGASMGGTASLVAGERAQALSSIRLAGVVTLSAPVEFKGLSAAAAVPGIIVPLLFIAAENDAGAAGARQLEQLSSGKGDVQIVPGSDHGTELLTGAQGEKVYQLLLGFIKASLG